MFKRWLDPETLRYFRLASLATLIPMLLLVSPIIGYFLGDFIDGLAGTDPYGGLLFLALGMIAGVRQTYLIIKRIWDEQKKNGT